MYSTAYSVVSLRAKRGNLIKRKRRRDSLCVIVGEAISCNIVIANEVWQSHKNEKYYFFQMRLPSLFRAKRRNPINPRNDSEWKRFQFFFTPDSNCPMMTREILR